ncbi:MAG: hypothetical protein WC309_01615 [Candidatus Paceibacterota bacterium]|jgi:hypothetical protein
MSKNKPPSSKRKITELHRKIDKEKKAKNEIYTIASNALKNYIHVCDIAGKILDDMEGAYREEIQSHIRYESQILERYREFINKERYLTTISFREYLERRLSGKFLTIIIAKLFKNSYQARFSHEWELFEGLAKYYNAHNLPVNRHKEIRRFHIIQDIISDVKLTEEVMCHKYDLQKAELMTIIEEIRKELRGLIIE